MAAVQPVPVPAIFRSFFGSKKRTTKVHEPLNNCQDDHFFWKYSILSFNVIGTQSIDTERYISISQSEACEGFEGRQKGNVTMEELERNTIPENL